MKVSLSKKHIIFEIGMFTVISRLLEGDFLDYERAIPKTSTTEVRINRRIYQECFERVDIVTEERLINPVKLLIADDKISIECATAVGRIKESLPAKIEGPALEIGFNNRYILDALKAAPSEEINVCLNTGSSPCIITPADESDKFLYMVLPVRLKAE